MWGEARLRSREHSLLVRNSLLVRGGVVGRCRTLILVVSFASLSVLEWEVCVCGKFCPPQLPVLKAHCLVPQM